MSARGAAVPLDHRQFRQVVGQSATGVTVLAAQWDTEVRGMTANARRADRLRHPASRQPDPRIAPLSDTCFLPTLVATERVAGGL
jgi:hypothetical protein